MTESEKRPVSDEASPAAKPQADTAPQAAAEPVPSTALERDLADMKDRLLRTLAEMENLRKRTEREVSDARAYGISSFARDVLSVADNMQRALHTPDVEQLARADGAAKALIDGLELTERELLNVLEKHGVKRIDPMGERFDPNRHQAMYEVPDPSVPSGQVVQVVQAGYLIGERVLRPALVAVSKGGPKPGAAPAKDGEGAASNGGAA